MTLEITIDTSPLLDLIDATGSHRAVSQILEASESGHLDVVVSSRVFYPDVEGMRETQREELRTLLEDKDVGTRGSVFRLGMSPLGSPPRGGDILGPPDDGVRSSEEMRRFEAVVGPAPEDRDNLSRNDIADYDALRDHYAHGRDVLVTLDTKGYFSEHERRVYEDKLGLVVVGPEEFNERFADQF